MIALLSFPRSGNTFLRVCIEMITNKATIGYQQLTTIGSELINKNAEVIITKRHSVDSIVRNSSKLILIVRNYKECLIRQLDLTELNVVKDFLENENPDKVGSNYIGNIKFFDGYKGEKLLVKYEDLISDRLIDVLKGVVDFIGEDWINDFTEQELRDFGLKKYNKSQTKGKHKIHHSNRLTKQEHKQWEEFFSTTYPDLFEKYINI